jgi:hypothetical protein
LYLKRGCNKNTGRTYLSIVRKFRDSQTGAAKDEVITKIGYLDEFENDYPDPIAHFKDAAIMKI